jgi:acyl-CoA thioesterase I
MNNFRRTCLLFSPLIIISMLIVADAETIDLKGQVVDSRSVPIKGVTVRLQKAGIELVTDTNGIFHFLDPAISSSDMLHLQVNQPPVAFFGKWVNIRLDHLSPVKIEFITISGKQIVAIIDKTLNKGTYRFNTIPPGTVSHSQLMIINVTINSIRYSALTNPSFDIITSTYHQKEPSRGNGWPGKKQLTAIDSIVLQKAGSITKHVAVTSYIDSLGPIILMGQLTRLIQNLLAGTPQTIVCYGTSLTYGGAWVNHLRDTLSYRFPGLVTVINSGMSGNSSWLGISELKNRVIVKNPNTVFIEFAVNDAYEGSVFGNYLYCTLEQSRDNLNAIIDTTLAAFPNCEFIPMTMNIPTGNDATMRTGLENYYEVYRQVARDRGLVYVDNYQSWKTIYDANLPLYMSYLGDPIHPNSTGSLTVTAPRIEQTVFEGQIQPY